MLQTLRNCAKFCGKCRPRVCRWCGSLSAFHFRRSPQQPLNRSIFAPTTHCLQLDGERRRCASTRANTSIHCIESKPDEQFLGRASSWSSAKHSPTGSLLPKSTKIRTASVVCTLLRGKSEDPLSGLLGTENLSRRESSQEFDCQQAEVINHRNPVRRSGMTEEHCEGGDVPGKATKSTG